MRFATSLMIPLVMLMAAVLPSQSPARVPDIYPDPQQAQTDLAAALRGAAASHRRVILDFGGNWCTDCHVLDSYFHDAANKTLLESNFILVHVNIGQEDRNLDLAERFEIPLKKGVPALVVIEPDGSMVHAQKAGEFEAMRHMQSQAVTDFLMRWKPLPAP